MADTLTVDAPTTTSAPRPVEKESVEDLHRRARKPPADGPCKGCGQQRPLNRLFLCYSCWTKKNLLDWAKETGADWIPGDPHPPHCACVLPEHAGAART